MKQIKQTGPNIMSENNRGVTRIRLKRSHITRLVLSLFMLSVFMALVSVGMLQQNGEKVTDQLPIQTITNPPTQTPQPSPSATPKSLTIHLIPHFPPTPTFKTVTVLSSIGGTTEPPEGTYTQIENLEIVVTTNKDYLFSCWEITSDGVTWTEPPWNPCIVIYDGCTIRPIFTYIGVGASPTESPAPSPTPTQSPTSLSWAGLNWTIVDGTWNVINNTVFGSGSAEALVTADNTNQTNYQVTMNTIIIGGVTKNESSIVIRYVDANNFYWMGVGCWGHEFSISRMLNGVATEIVSYGLESNLQRGVTYTLTGVANSNILTLYVNEIQVLQIADSAFGFGAFGIRTFDSSLQTLDILQH